MNSAKRELIPKILFLASLVYLIISTLQNRIGYHDTGVMRGIEIGVIFVVFSFNVLFLFGGEKVSHMAIYSMVYLSVLNSIPALKYSLPYGTYDPMVHLALVKEIYSSGYIPIMTYSEFPIMHILHTCISTISGIPLLTLFKHIIPVVMGLVPLLVYIVSRIIFNDGDLQRFAVFSSTFLFKNYNYAIAPASLATFFMLAIVVFLARLISEGKRVTRGVTHSALVLFMIAFLVIVHSVASFTLTFVLLMILLLFIFYGKYALWERHRILRIMSILSTIIMFSAVCLISWWVFQSSFVFTRFINIVSDFVFTYERAEPLPILEGIRKYGIEVLLRLNIGKLEILILSFIGLCLSLFSSSQKKIIKDEITFKMLAAFAGANAFLLALEYEIVEIGLFLRPLIYGFLVAPFFSAISLNLLNTILKKRIRTKLVSNSIRLFLFFLLLSFPLYEFFPDEVPHLAWNYVNSEYQYRQVKFIEKNPTTLSVVVDELSYWQIQGFCSPEVYQSVIPYRKTLILSALGIESPTILLPYINIAGGCIILIHKPGRSGFIQEYPTLDNYTIDMALQNMNLIYNNGESYILYRTKIVSESV